jgi:hypothetical protein
VLSARRAPSMGLGRAGDGPLVADGRARRALHADSISSRRACADPALVIDRRPWPLERF